MGKNAPNLSIGLPCFPCVTEAASCMYPTAICPHSHLDFRLLDDVIVHQESLDHLLRVPFHETWVRNLSN